MNAAADIKLVQPAPVVRDANGEWMHPQFPAIEEGEVEKWKAWVAAQGLEWVSHHLEQDDSAEARKVADAYFEGRTISFASWNSAPPEGEGWFTLCISDTEDGPAWLWARRKSEAIAA